MSTLNVNNIAPESGSEIGVADNIITRPIFKDYGETVNVIGSIGGGSINYETGEFRLNNCHPNAPFVVSATFFVSSIVLPKFFIYSSVKPIFLNCSTDSDFK